MENKRVSFGLTSWDERNQTSNTDNNNQERIPFMRLKEGNNILRIITQPAKYWQVRFQDGKSQFGKRVRCAFPGVDRNDCPTVQAGLKPKKRYIVGVIHRSAEEGNSVKLLDLSVLTYEQLQSFKEDPEFGTPDKYDINIRFNPKASSPQGFYSVIPRQVSPLSEDDQALIDQIGLNVIEENLIRLSTPPPVERVHETLMKMGWDGESKVVPIEQGSSSGVEVKESSDDDFDFSDAAEG